MKHIQIADIQIKGELLTRLQMNYNRLEGEWYRPHEVFTADQHGWPGDWEGRLILALCLLNGSTGRKPVFLEQIMEQLPVHFNSKGYLGEIMENGRLDEQQIAGHSWLLRGLIAYYKLTGKEEVKGYIEQIAENFLLPAVNKFKQYPTDPQTRFLKQDIWSLSKLQSKTKNHAESSDAGCAFIMLDGAVDTYEFLGYKELAVLIEEMIGKFVELDLSGLHIQTHATLSACRGILHYYELTGEDKYLAAVQRIFDKYKKEAWTEAYGNYNWFGIPRWTESCAVIDSFLLSTGLWSALGETEYLEDAHKIYYNGICHGQRAMGGFGTDSCTGALLSANPALLSPVTYDVYWCCNMRGGEGLSRAVEYNFFMEGEDIYVPFYNSCTVELMGTQGKLVLEEQSGYPYEGKVSFAVKESTSQSRRFHFYVPKYCKEGAVLRLNKEEVLTEEREGFLMCELKLKKNDTLILEWKTKVRIEDTFSDYSIKDYHKIYYGQLLLGRSIEDGEVLVSMPSDAQFERLDKSSFKEKRTGVVLTALCDVEKGTKSGTKRQILFPDIT